MLVHGFYRKCGSCQAPWPGRLPEGWTVTTSKYARIQRATPHLPECPAGFTKVEVPDVSGWPWEDDDEPE